MNEGVNPTEVAKELERFLDGFEEYYHSAARATTPARRGFAENHRVPLRRAEPRITNLLL